MSINKIKKIFWVSLSFFISFFGNGSAFAQPVDTGSGINTAVIPNPLGAGNDTLFKFITTLLDTIFPIAGIVAVFFLIYSGFRMVIFASNEEKLSNARQAFLWTVIGIAILLGAKVLSAVICGTIQQLGTPSLSCPKP